MVASLQLKLLPALHFAGELLLSVRRFVISLADLFHLLSGKGFVLEDQGNALSLLIQGQEGFVPSKSLLELRNTSETATPFTRGVFPKS